MGIGDHELDALEATLEVAQEAGPKTWSSEGPVSHPTTWRWPSHSTPTATTVATELSHLVEGGIEPQIGVLALDRAAQERLDVVVESIVQSLELSQIP